MIRNPFIARGMIKSKDRFWGRASESRTIYSLLLDSEEEPQSIAIVGLRKIGKSSLLYRISQKRDAPFMYTDQLDRTVFVMLSMQALSDASADGFFTMILEELGRRNNAASEMLSTSSSRVSVSPDHKLVQLLRMMDRQNYLLVLLLDEFECATVNPSFDKNFFDLLRSIAQQWRVAFVVATQNDLDQLWDGSLVSSPYSSPFFNFFQTLTLVGFQDGEGEEYLKTLSLEAGSPFGKREIEMIESVGGCFPFFLNVAAYHIFQLLAQRDDRWQYDRDSLWSQITRDPTIYGNFKYYWGNLTPFCRQALVEVTNERLSEPWVPDVRVDLNWLDRMGLVKRRDDGAYEPFSRAFREFVSEVSPKISETTSGEASREKTVQDLVSESESASLEFKSTLRWDINRNKVNKDLQHSCLKTIAAFLNSDGGTLIIGLRDDATVYGIERDLETLRGKSIDVFEQTLMNLVHEHIGTQFARFMKVRFETIEGRVLCIVDVDKAPKPAFLGKGSNKEFYVRLGNTSRSLDMEKAFRYIELNSV